LTKEDLTLALAVSAEARIETKAKLVGEIKVKLVEKPVKYAVYAYRQRYLLVIVRLETRQGLYAV
jgi:hypothetical protein